MILSSLLRRYFTSIWYFSDIETHQCVFSSGVDAAVDACCCQICLGSGLRIKMALKAIDVRIKSNINHSSKKLE
jgi:hypothetical protein